MKTLLIRTAEEMLRYGALLGTLLRGGEVLVLSGDLGAGKTTFVQGVAKGMGLLGPVTSPSFALIHVHEGAPSLVHCDFYRLQGSEEVEGVGFYDYLSLENVVIIEWGEGFFEVLPKRIVHISIKSVSQGREMLIAVSDEQDRLWVKEWIELCLR